jgi:hypothetical protein
LDNRRVALAALAVLLAATAALLYHETRGTLFWVDEWSWVLHRRGHSVSTYLSPHNQHLVLIPVALYQLLFATFGLHSYAPYRVMVLLAHLTCGTLLFIYARRRVGDWAALAVAAILLLLGPAWENFLWPFQTSWLISLGAGLGALLLLDRGDRRGDIGACVLTAVTLSSSGLGLPIALGLTVELAVGRRRIKEMWIVGLPLGLYALWWIGYQHAGTSSTSVLSGPGFVASEAAAAVSSLFGLAGEVGFDGQGTLLTWGAPLAVLMAAGLCWRLARMQTVPARVIGLATIVLSFWTLTAISRSILGNPYSGRYIYVGALVILLLGVELARGWVPSRRIAVSLALAALVVVVSNLSSLRTGAQLLRGFGRVTAASLGALDIGRGVVAPGYVLHKIPLFPLVAVTARDYFAATHADGDPAASEATIAADPESVRLLADSELVGIDRVSVQPATTPPSCPPATPSAAGVIVPAGGLLIRSNDGPVRIGVRRFADGFQPLGTVTAGATAIVHIPRDRSTRPWRLQFTPADSVTVCPAV